MLRESRSRVHRLDHANQADVLHDRRINAAVDALAEVLQRLGHLVRLDQDVEREVDARPALMSDQAGLLQLVHRELGPVVARVELRRTAVDGVGAVGDGGADGVD